jgi:hypothetical protein
MEAARLGQAEIALQIIAKLMNVTPSSNKTWVSFNRHYAS